MDESGLRRWRAVIVLGVSGAGAVPGLSLGLTGLALTGCHGSTAGGRAADGGRDVVGDSLEKLPAPDAGCSEDGPGGGGVCHINFCGQVKSAASLGFGEVASAGADVLCTPPDVCVPAGATAAGDALQLRCVTPLDGAAMFGAACATGAGQALPRCKDDSLCVAGPAGGGARFCSALCRSDTDCPADAACLEYASESLPNGSQARFGRCAPLGALGVTACAREADCPATSGCVSYDPRTALRVCRPVTGTKSLGEPCTAAAQCRSGECYDRDGHLPAAQSRAFCAGACAKNSDCGADQRCVRLVTGNNGTPSDPTDDVVVGYCRTLVVPSAALACGVAADCVARNDGSDTCDARTGVCYKASAAPGAPCLTDAACELGGACATGAVFPGGYCRLSGCAPGAAAGSLDACPGAGAVCSQRASDMPVRNCYEGCAQAGDCSRFPSGYVCMPPRAGATPAPADPLICLAGGGA